jgi:hypothetical protein
MGTARRIRVLWAVQDVAKGVEQAIEQVFNMSAKV